MKGTNISHYRYLTDRTQHKLIQEAKEASSNRITLGTLRTTMNYVETRVKDGEDIYLKDLQNYILHNTIPGTYIKYAKMEAPSNHTRKYYQMLRIYESKEAYDKVVQNLIDTNEIDSDEGDIYEPISPYTLFDSDNYFDFIHDPHPEDDPTGDSDPEVPFRIVIQDAYTKPIDTVKDDLRTIQYFDDFTSLQTLKGHEWDKTETLLIRKYQSNNELDYRRVIGRYSKSIITIDDLEHLVFNIRFNHKLDIKTLDFQFDQVAIALTTFFGPDLCQVVFTNSNDWIIKIGDLYITKSLQIHKEGLYYV